MAGLDRVLKLVIRGNSWKKLALAAWGSTIRRRLEGGSPERGNVSSSTPSMPVAGTDGHLHAFAPAWYHGQQDTRQGRTREGVR